MSVTEYLNSHTPLEQLQELYLRKTKTKKQLSASDINNFISDFKAQLKKRENNYDNTFIHKRRNEIIELSDWDDPLFSNQMFVEYSTKLLNEVYLYKVDTLEKVQLLFPPDSPEYESLKLIISNSFEKWYLAFSDDAEYIDKRNNAFHLETKASFRFLYGDIFPKIKGSDIHPTTHEILWHVDMITDSQELEPILLHNLKMKFKQWAQANHLINEVEFLRLMILKFNQEICENVIRPGLNERELQRILSSGVILQAELQAAKLRLKEITGGDIEVQVVSEAEEIPKALAFKDIFMVANYRKYIDVLTKTKPALLTEKWEFIGKPKKHKGVICAWIKHLQKESIINVTINRAQLSKIFNNELHNFNLGLDGKTFANDSYEYEKIFKNQIEDLLQP